MRKITSSRGGRLSEEDRALWRAVAKSTIPLKRTRRARDDHPEAGEGDPAEAVHAPSAQPSRDSGVAVKKPVAKVAPPPLAPIGRKEKARLSRGRQDIHARLDLHGMTQTRAHRVLLSFLQTSRDDGATFVLVITGRGRTSAPQSERGVLRRQVPLWFDLPEFRALIVGFEQAHMAHGGEGALYVRLRRAR